MLEEPLPEPAPERAWAIAPALLLAAASLCLAVVLGAGPRSPHEIAAVFPPWWSQERVFAAASEAGAVTAVGGAHYVLVIAAADPELPARLNAAGALLQLDPILSGLCAEPRGEANV